MRRHKTRTSPPPPSFSLLLHSPRPHPSFPLLPSLHSPRPTPLPLLPSCHLPSLPPLPLLPPPFTPSPSLPSPRPLKAPPCIRCGVRRRCIIESPSRTAALFSVTVLDVVFRVFSYFFVLFVFLFSFSFLFYVFRFFVFFDFFFFF